MHLKLNNKGVTLVELIVAITILTIVLSAAYCLLTFSTKSLKNTEAQFDAEQDARAAFLSMEEDIRKAQSATYGGINHKAVEVLASGMQINVYTDTDKDNTLEMVQYILDADHLKRVVVELDSTPISNTILVHKVQNNVLSPVVPIFSVNGKLVSINLIVIDSNEVLSDDPVSLTTSIAVRSKGAMN